MTFRSATDVSDSNEAAMLFPPSFSMGQFEKSSMLSMGPEALIEKEGSIRYLSLLLRNSIDDDGLTSSFPSRSSLFSLDGTPAVNLKEEQSHFLSR
jgi:hypothetical protein